MNGLLSHLMTLKERQLKKGGAVYRSERERLFFTGSSPFAIALYRFVDRGGGRDHTVGVMSKGLHLLLMTAYLFVIAYLQRGDPSI